jgi:hypothetical protein
VKNSDGVVSLELRTSKKNISSRFWNFLGKFGYDYSEGTSRPLLPIEVSLFLLHCKCLMKDLLIDTDTTWTNNLLLYGFLLGVKGIVKR